MAQTRSQEKLPDLAVPSPLVDLRRVLSATAGLGLGEEVILEGINPDSAEQVLYSAELKKETSFRASYNSVTRSLLLRGMPSELHDSCQVWIHVETIHMLQAGWLTFEESLQLVKIVGTTIGNFHMPCTNSIKEPDTALRVRGEGFPSLVIETGCSESYPKLKQDIDLWMVGTGGVTKVCILVKFSARAGSRLAGYIEVARPMLGGGYTFDVRQDLFPMSPNQPQSIRITRADLFGNQIVAGRNSLDTWDLQLDRFREVAAEAAARQGFTPP
ncbi:hypothetical protein DFH27DRAFT_117781 [Peziza echinospora]|nr:hypothetical protein DFH27DRAFT_117781 [Peziza echinospora]